MMIAVGAVTLQVLSCIGLGVIIIRLLRLNSEFSRGELYGWAFAIGFGVLGWLLFFMGIAGRYDPMWIAILLLAFTPGILLTLGRDSCRPSAQKTKYRLEIVDWFLIAALIVVLGMDLAEGLSPPADGDSMAYHFALPKQFLLAGHLEFVPRALDGAIPLLVQQTYLSVLGVGGERAMTLWVMVSGWSAAALVFIICHRYLNVRWSLAATLLYLTVPAIVFGGGSGQVEAKNAMFVLVSAFALTESRRTGSRGFLVLAGLGAGFFAASKFLGLLFIAAAGLTILLGRRAITRSAIFGIAALIAGSQWYFWNWWNSGDPVFPMLFGILEYSNLSFWDGLHDKFLNDVMLASEKAVPINLTWFLTYPFIATLAGRPEFESMRTGLGPFVLLALPFALAASWRYRYSIKKNPIFYLGVIAFLFYAFWFFTGSSQRIRHVVPVYPLLLICSIIAAHRWATASNNLRPLVAIVFISLGIQLAGHGVFSANYIRHIISGETREVFYRRNVTQFDPVPWINSHLIQSDKLLVQARQLIYLFDIPTYYAHHSIEALVDIRPGANNPKKLLHQLNSLGINYLLVTDSTPPPASVGLDQWRALLKTNCLKKVRNFSTTSISSRSLPSAGQHPGQMFLLIVDDDACIKSGFADKHPAAKP